MPPEKQLDCLLIAPPALYENNETIWKGIHATFPHLGLASLASYVRSKGHSVKIIDCAIEAPSVKAFETFIKEKLFLEYPLIRVIGVTGLTFNINKAYRIADICKQHYPSATIVFGGPHPTVLPDEALQKKDIDIVVIGEGEHTLEEILSKKEISTINGIAYKTITDSHQIEIKKNPPRERIKNIDVLPMPAYDLLPIDSYTPAKGSYKRLPAMSMVTSRGCPGQCTFCANTLGRQISFRSAEKIFEEIIYLKKTYGIREILFYDDAFTTYKQNVIKLCDLLIAYKTDITWTCFARVDYIDKETLKKMKLSGCHQIMYGIENIDPRVLKNVHKKIQIEQVENAIRWTQEVGIELRLAFMVGNPGDTEEIIQKNIKFINKVNPDLLIINVTTPFPGTEMFEWAKEKGLILTYNWDDYALVKPVMKLENLSAEKIQELYRHIYKQFYMRPSYILKKIFSIRSFADINILWQGLLSILSFIKK